MLCKYLEQREADVKRRKVIPESNHCEGGRYILLKGCKTATVKSSSFSLVPIKSTESFHRDKPFVPGKNDIVEDDKSGTESPYDEYMQQRSLKLHRSPSQAEVNLFFDGGARPNPGPVGGAGYALFDHLGECVASNSVRIDWTQSYKKKLINNHEAEYIGLIHGLKAAVRYHVDRLVVMGDSELVINQMKQIHEAHKDSQTNLVLFRLHSHANQLMKQFRHIRFKWISRFRNNVTDSLTKSAQLHSKPEHESADWFLPSLKTACILYS